jgi:signal transduction histidine kinase/ligand-binding sensor domain-containing protein/DNA-binding response OmpR family regulator
LPRSSRPIARRWSLSSRALSGIALATGAIIAESSARAQALRSSATPVAPAASANFVHESWTVHNGLPVNALTGILQSRDGYLWLATFDGLVRFDGVQFRVFNTSSHDSLPSNRILGLLETSDSTLWLRTQQLHLVALRDGGFVEYGTAQGIEPRATTGLFPDSGGGLLVSTRRGLHELRGDRFVRVGGNALTGYVTWPARGSDGALWVGTESQGLFRVQGDSVRRYRVVDGLPNDSIGTLFIDRQERLWMAHPSGVSRFADGRFERVPLPMPERTLVTQFFESRDGRLWVGTSVGVFVIEDGRARASRDGLRTPVITGAIRQDDGGAVCWHSEAAFVCDERVVYRLDQGNGTPNPEYQIKGFHRDHEGSVWLVTDAAGLHRLKPSLFQVYSAPEGVAGRNIYSVLEDRRGVMWIGTWGQGLTRLEGNVTTTFNTTVGAPAFVHSLMEDNEGRLWVGGMNSGVCRLEAGICRRVVGEGLESATEVFAMHQDRTGAVWLGAVDGVHRLRDGAWTHFGEAQGAAMVRVFLESADGAIWMGSNGGGLLRYKDGRLGRLTMADGLPSDLIRALHQDVRGALWVGTEGRGLARLEFAPNDSAPRITSYRARHGLFDEVIHQIVEDDAGRLWMSSNRGIFWIARSELEAFAAQRVTRIRSTAYGERDGLRNREANGGVQPAGIRARDGRLWFATQDGAVVIDPAQIRPNAVVPPVLVEELSIAHASFRPDSGQIELTTGARDFQIAYTALSFLAPENVRFRYRLDNFNDDWIEAGDRRFAYYTNVPPGRYVFRVIASNNDGLWNETGATMAIRIPPFLWETALFRAFVVLVSVVAIVLLFQWRLRSLNQRQMELNRLVDDRTRRLRTQETLLKEQNATLEAQARLLQQIDHMKSTFFANISHEFRTPLTLTIGPLEDLRAGRHGAVGPEADRQLNFALRNARRLLRLVNQILDVARLEAGQTKLRATRFDVIPYVRGIALAFAPVAERKRIAFDVVTPDRPLELWYDGEQLEKVFTNLLSNAFKFTPEGGHVALSISLEVSGDEPNEAGAAIIRVTDDGPGISAGDLSHVFERFYRVEESDTRREAGTGIGLSLARELVELHGGSISVESGERSGTTFTVRLPTGRAHLRDDQVADEIEPEHEASAALLDITGEQSAPDPFAIPRKKPSTDDTDRTTVLVVDDNAEVRAYLRTHLERRFRVVEASGGTTALPMARDVLPDLVISDVMMQDMDGFTLCRTLKEDPETDFIPVILLTARAGQEDRIAGLLGGADDYVVKPFDIRELEVRATNLIDSRRRLRERFAATGLPRRDVEVPITPVDDAYLARVHRAIEENIANGDFGVAELAAAVNQDRSHLYRRLQDLLGQSPSEVIREVRLERSAELLSAHAGSVAEVAYAVGFNSVSYFSRSFREAFGVTPSEFVSRSALRGPRSETARVASS